VIDTADVPRVRDAGGRIVVMPHADVAVIRAAKAAGMLCVPGVATPTEAFAALAAGADGLKMFPAEGLPPGTLRAWRAVLPRDTLVFAVGGMRPDNLEPYWVAGASGFGTGSQLYKPGAAPGVVREVAMSYAAAIRALPQH
jgi:2-dehydro-3-deoxyphosphogalactonate aldolase